MPSTSQTGQPLPRCQFSAAGLSNLRPCSGTARAASALVALLLTLAGVAVAESPPPLVAEMPEIVTRSIEAHGGEAFRQSETRYQLCSKSGCVDVRVRVEGGLYEHEVEGDFGGEQRRIRVDNAHVELWIEGEKQAVSPKDEQRWRDSVTSRMYHVFLPHKLADPSVLFADLGLETWGGRQLHRVAVGFETGTSTDHDDQMAFWFDPETARLEQFAYSYHGNPDGLRFRRLHNYRRVGGLLFYDQANLGWEGPGLTITQLDAATVEKLRHVSDVEMKTIGVTLLGESATAPSADSP